MNSEDEDVTLTDWIRYMIVENVTGAVEICIINGLSRQCQTTFFPINFVWRACFSQKVRRVDQIDCAFVGVYAIRLLGLTAIVGSLLKKKQLPDRSNPN